jgi:FkbM family methyltransferase
MDRILRGLDETHDPVCRECFGLRSSFLVILSSQPQIQDDGAARNKPCVGCWGQCRPVCIRPAQEWAQGQDAVLRASARSVCKPLNQSRPRQRWTVVNSACGAKKQTATINVAKNSYSSSLLPIFDRHVQNAKDSTYVSQEEISVCSLDEEVLSSLTAKDKVWLKIDTQGYEAEVLKGAAGLMNRVSGLECELSILPLYDGQPLIDEMIRLLYESGLRLVDIAPGFCEVDTGYALQLDRIFLGM